MRERSRSSERHRSDRRKRKKKSSRKSKKRSRSPSRTHRSRSSSYSSGRSRSSSRSRHRSSRHSRSPAKRSHHSSREVSRSRSRSSSGGRSRRKSPKHSRKSRSRSREKTRTKIEKPVILTAEEQLKLKVQKALKAAATADAQLRGLSGPEISETAEPSSVSISDQLSRVSTIEEINSSGFQPQTFISNRSAPKPSQEEELGVHDTAIYGKAIVSTEFGSKSLSNVLVLDENNLAHEKLCLNLDKKKERWHKKLVEMRLSLLT